MECRPGQHGIPPPGLMGPCGLPGFHAAWEVPTHPDDCNDNDENAVDDPPDDNNVSGNENHSERNGHDNINDND
eukprot:2428306-Karenia_brevis.AAC.1